MSYTNLFFKALGVKKYSTTDINSVAKKTGIPVSRLNYYNNKNLIPSGLDLQKLIESYGISEFELRLKMGRLDKHSIEILQMKADSIIDISRDINIERTVNKNKTKEVLNTNLGTLFQGDCLDVLQNIPSDSVDLVFADPPFNLDKLYPSKINDKIKENEYLAWTEKWLNECIRVLKHGGSLFVWNLPIWNSHIASFLHGSLTFKHWIATDMKYSLPIRGRLYPSHYSLMYFVKGEKANKFEADRLPTPTCPKCFGDLKDYGGYKHKMNPLGISLTDIWLDIQPVRHAKYKKREANELPVRLLDRIIEMSTNPGDLVLDPFGGSGTTFVVAELKGRKWVGCEIGPCNDILARFDNLDGDIYNLKNIRNSLNHLFPEAVRKNREKYGLWTVESIAEKNKTK